MEARRDRDMLRYKPNTPPRPLEGGSRKINTRERATKLLDVVQRWGTVTNAKYLELISAVIKT